MTRVLVTGGGGQLGREFALLLGADAAAPGARRARRRRRRRSVARAFAEHRPELVLHSAAWTDVDGAEADPEGARAVNEEGSRNVARAARAARRRARRRSRPTTSSRATTRRATTSARRSRRAASTAPRSSRASARCCAEHPEAYVVRTAWVFSPRGRNFLLHDAAPRRRARRAARRRRPDRLPDLRRVHLAAATLDLVERCPPGHLPPRRRRLDELARLRERDHGGRRPAPRASSRSRSSELRAAGAAARLLDPANRARQRPAAATLAGKGCATVSPPWPTRRRT